MKIVLWVPWLTVYNNLDTIFKTYAEWGIPAVKIDFMDHADQWMVNFYKQVTAEAAVPHRPGLARRFHPGRPGI